MINGSIYFLVLSRINSQNQWVCVIFSIRTSDTIHFINSFIKLGQYDSRTS